MFKKEQNAGKNRKSLWSFLCERRAYEILSLHDIILIKAK